MTVNRPYRVLMVCTGNICRSPSAEGVFRHMLEQADLAARVSVDSAGTSGWHIGDRPSGPAIVAAEARGYDFSGITARQLCEADFVEFDLILAMDQGHMNRLQAARPAGATAQMSMFLETAPTTGRVDVPDPYYGDRSDYEYALDLIEAGCRGWIARLKEAL